MSSYEMEPLFIYPEKVYWHCPSCGRVVSAYAIDTCSPDTYCRCQMPKYMIIMEPLVPLSKCKEVKDGRVQSEDPV